MATITINYNAKNTAIRGMIAALLKFDGVTEVPAKTESHYNPEFVAKIKKSQKEAGQGKAKTIKIEDLWK